MNQLFCSLTCCLIGWGVVAFDISEDYARVRKLQLTDPVVETGNAVWYPDADFYAEVDDLAADWRVASPTGREIEAHLIRIEDPVFSATYEECPSKIIASGRLSGNTVSQIWELELPDTTSELSAVELKISNRSFEKLLTVEIAANGGDWHRVVSAQPLTGTPDRDFAGGFRAYFPLRGDGNRVRITIEDRVNELNPMPSEELRVESIRLLRRTPEPLDRVPRRQPTTLPQLQHAVRNRRTALAFDAKRVPLTGFEFQTDSRNFARRFTLHGSEDLKGWHTVSEGLLRADDNGLGELIFDFEPSRYRYYQLEIENGDSAELVDIRVKWFQTSYRMVFAEALPALHLYFGGNTERPAYPEVTFTPDELTKLPVYQALPPEENQKYHPFITQEHNYPARVYMLLAAVSLTVGAILFLAMRHLKHHPAE